MNKINNQSKDLILIKVGLDTIIITGLCKRIKKKINGGGYELQDMETYRMFYGTYEKPINSQGWHRGQKK